MKKRNFEAVSWQGILTAGEKSFPLARVRPRAGGRSKINDMAKKFADIIEGEHHKSTEIGVIFL